MAFEGGGKKYMHKNFKFLITCPVFEDEVRVLLSGSFLST